VAALPERPVFARLADGRLLAVSMPEPGSEVRARTSVDRGVTWGEPVSLLRLPPEPGGWAGLELLADRDGELHLFLLNDAGTGVIRTGEGQHLESPASRRLDIWHARSTGGGRSWPLPRCIW
jgi:hypothetical protein